MAARRSTLWFGFLEAGDKGSPVVRDSSLDTGSRDKIYLFNFNKGRILEYRRDIAEPKLRELTDGEADLVAALREAYEETRSRFTPRYIAQPPRRRKKSIEIDHPPDSDDISDDLPPPLVGDDDAETAEYDV